MLPVLQSALDRLSPPLLLWSSSLLKAVVVRLCASQVLCSIRPEQPAQAMGWQRRAEQPAKSVSAKPLTADEIVQSQLRKSQAGNSLAKGVSGKVPRLDNKSMLEAASKRRQGPGRHGAMVRFSPDQEIPRPHCVSLDSNGMAMPNPGNSQGRTA